MKPNEVFVFGSNLAGIHGAGSAKAALKQYGAVFGKGIGHFGQSYAIPTKDRDINTLPLENIQKYVNDFICYASSRPDLVFIVTEIGCGLAGYSPKDIAPMLKECIEMKNVVLPKRFEDEIKRLSKIST